MLLRSRSSIPIHCNLQSRHARSETDTHIREYEESASEHKIIVRCADGRSVLCCLIFLTVAVGCSMEYGLVTIFGVSCTLGRVYWGEREALCGLPTVLVWPAHGACVACHLACVACRHSTK